MRRFRSPLPLRFEALESRDVPSTYYVSTTGNDANAGGSAAPWLTLQHAVDSARPGDSIEVTSGTYAGCRIGNSGTAAAPITLEAAPGASVLINAPGAGNKHGSDIEVENFSGTVSYWTIRGLEVANAPTNAGIDVRVTSHITVQNCYAHNNHNWGIFLAFSDYATIVGNHCSYSQVQHGIYDSNSGDYAVIAGNECDHNYAAGIHMNGDISSGGDGIITGALVEGNIIHDNGAGGGSGINCDGVQDSTIRNNLLYNNHASGISLFQIDGGGASVRDVIVNNTILEASDARWAINLQNASTSTTVLNNVLYNYNTSHGSIDTSSDSLSGLVSDHNVVMNLFTPDDSTFVTLAQWQSQTGQDKHSIIATPAQLFVSPAANNYHLSSTSPAIDAGTSTDAPSKDIAGNPRPSGAGYDIGAYEYQQASPTPTPTPTPAPPVANGDSYNVVRNQSLSVAAPGVLANDTSPSGQSLTASLASGPGHGTLKLNADGSFVYTPASGWTGTDSFTYVAKDGSGTSAPATVTLIVAAPGKGKPKSQAQPLAAPSAGSTLAVGSGTGSGGAHLLNADGTQRFAATPFGAGFAGGVRTASADVNGDGTPDLVVGTGPGGPTQVKVLDGNTQAVLFTFQPFEASFTGGVFVTAGDVNGDGFADVVVTPDEGGGPRVRVFSGKDGSVIADFLGIDDPNFRGGARAALADVNGDGTPDLVVAAGFGGGPRVAVFDGKSLTSGAPQKLFGDIFVFEQSLRNGVFVTGGDLNGDGDADLILGGGPGGGPRVFALSGKDLLGGNQVQLANFFGGSPASTGGIRVAARDLDGDGKADIIVGAGDGSGSRVTEYAGKDVPADGTPPELAAFDAFPGQAGGVFVG